MLLRTMCVMVLIAGCDGVAYGVLGRSDPLNPTVPEDPKPFNPKPPGQKPTDDRPQVGAPPDQWIPAEVQMRRLARVELAYALQDALKVSVPELFSALPPDDGPYDTDYTLQRASNVWIEGWETVAGLAATRALTGAARTALMVCTPVSPGDPACLNEITSRVGRLLFRRSLTADELSLYAPFAQIGADSGSFDEAVNATLRAMLQSPAFLFRIERGTPIEGQPGVYRLSAVEFATRLSFFFWGRPPPAWLIQQAEEGGLDTDSGVKDAVISLLADDRARAQVERFHAQWLGFSSLPYPAALSSAMQKETASLINRTVWARRDYLSIFTATETFADSTLIAHYGLNGTPGWVSYAGTDRKGILSHGSILARGVRSGETSPTLRGKWIRERLLCEVVPPPPPDVPADTPPKDVNGSRCKTARYSAHATNGSCAACHTKMDPIGFGLERYDAQGKFRTSEADAPECSISGEGALDQQGRFNGPAGLADLIVESGKLEPCLVKQLFRFGAGRHEEAADAPLLATLTRKFQSSGRDLEALLIDFATSPAFRQRREAP